MFQACFTGPVLSTALRIHVSPECKAVLDTLGGFYLEERGPVTLKVADKSFPFYRFLKASHIKINLKTKHAGYDLFNLKFKRCSVTDVNVKTS